MDKRDAATLIPLIQRHVPPSARIFSESWGAFSSLNDLGYEHFTACHKRNFKVTYNNEVTGLVCTNRIEGAWKHAKVYFKRMNGCTLCIFEGHLCEVIWRNHMRHDNIYESFCVQVSQIYQFGADPGFTYSNPVFTSWSAKKLAAKNEFYPRRQRCGY